MSAGAAALRRYEEEFLERAMPTDIGGTTVPLIDLGDLIIAKVLAARERQPKEDRCSAAG